MGDPNPSAPAAGSDRASETSRASSETGTPPESEDTDITAALESGTFLHRDWDSDLELDTDPGDAGIPGSGGAGSAPASPPDPDDADSEVTQEMRRSGGADSETTQEMGRPLRMPDPPAPRQSFTLPGSSQPPRATDAPPEPSEPPVAPSPPSPHGDSGEPDTETETRSGAGPTEDGEPVPDETPAARDTPAEGEVAPPVSPYLEASAFQDSGSFFRDRVARNLAERHGLNLEEPREPAEGEREPFRDDAEGNAAADPEPSEPSTIELDPPGAGSQEPTAMPADERDPTTSTAFNTVFEEEAGSGPEVHGARTEPPPERGSFQGPAPSGPPVPPPGFPGGYPTGGPGPSTPLGPPSGPQVPPEAGRTGVRPSVPGTGPQRPPSAGADAGGVPSGAVGSGQPSGPQVPPEAGRTGTYPAGAGGAAGPPPPPPEATGVHSRPEGALGQAAAAAGPVAPSPPETEETAEPDSLPAEGTQGEQGKKAKRTKGAKKAKKRRPLWFRLLRAALITIVGTFLLGLAAFGTAYAMIPVPDATQEAATDQGSKFYFSDGETLIAEQGVDREPIELEDVPEDVQNAVLAAEDRGFWDQPGVSVRGTFRALWSTATGQQLQGGSTITQQLVRNYYEGLSQEQTISRKLNEIIIAIKVDRQQPPEGYTNNKDWILEQYLNTIYFGRGAYGIQAAAQAYYDKNVDELTHEEAAFLAAAIQNPDPFGAADSETSPWMEERWEYVIEGLTEMGSITGAEAAEMEFPPPEPNNSGGSSWGGFNGYMMQQAMQELANLGYTEDQINRGAYEITTTFDADLMQIAQEAVEEHVDVDNLPEGVRAGLTAIDPATGEVVAFYGGKDYLENQYDSAFRGSAQAGSAFKPYVLAAALEEGYSLNSIVDGSAPMSVGGSTVGNSGGVNNPRMNLVQATQVSVNTGYIRLAQQVGLENVVSMAHAAGIPEDKITEDQAVAPTLALGVSDVSPVDQASGYATFANGGVYIEPHVVRSITNRDGEEERPEVEENRAMSESTAADVTHALQQVVNGGTGTRAAIGRPAAGKTGTTDSSVAAWFAGYTPQLSAAVGVYNGDNQPFSMPGYGALSGGTLPATIWQTFMSRAMEGEEVENFPGPSWGGTVHDWGGTPEPTEPPEDAEEEQEEQEQPAEPQEPEEPVEPSVEPDPGGGGDLGGDGEEPAREPNTDAPPGTEASTG